MTVDTSGIGLITDAMWRALVWSDNSIVPIKWQLISKQAFSVIGEVQHHTNTGERHGEWYWEARTFFNYRTKNLEPVCGYANSKESAMRIVECILIETDMITGAEELMI